jgi:RND superfamily putative drug exporter
MFARLAGLVTRYWWAVLAAWVAIPLLLVLVAPSWDKICRDGDFAYLPDRMTSQRGEKRVEQAFPDQASKSDIVLVVARQHGKLRPEDKEVADRLAEKFSPENFIPQPGAASPVKAVLTYQEPVIGPKLISPLGPNGQAVLLLLQLDTEFMAIDNIPTVVKVFDTVDAMRKEGLPKGLELGVSGSAAIGSDMLCSSGESIDNTELTTIILVVVILLLVYRAPGLVVIPLVAIAAAFIVSTSLIAMLAQWSEWTNWFEFRVFKTTKIFIVVILFGAATDYCLFLIARYREELERGLAPAEAIREALARTGHALTASAMTTILGLGAMVFADFGKYRYGGPTIAMALVAALAACVTVAPALLRAVGRLAFWPFGVGPGRGRHGQETVPQRGATVSQRGAAVPQRAKTVPQADDPAAGRGLLGRFWEGVAGLIVAHPGLILAGSFLVLAVPAYQGFSAFALPVIENAWLGVPAYQGASVPITYDMLSEMSADRVSVKGTRLLEQYFPIGETGPLSFLAYRPGYNFDTKDQRRQISQLTRELAEFTYVDSSGVETRPVLSVRSLTNPLGDPLLKRQRGIFGNAGKDAVERNRRTKAMFLSSQPGYPGDVTRFDLVCQYDPFSHESIRLLGQIDNKLKALAEDPAWAGTQFDLLGTTAGIRDLEAVNTSDTIRIGMLVSLAVLAVLVFLLRRPIVSLYLIFTVLLGFFVSLGLTKLFFAWLYGDTFQGLDWKLPVFLFVILVAVGEDYNIYLVTRVFEEQRRRGILEGLRVAVVRTGGIITSCGVIMAGTFASMLTGTLRGMIELGFSLALGVLLDTFIIRTILVPSFLALWDGRRERAALAAAAATARAADAPGSPHFEAAEPSGPRSLSGPVGRRAG